MNLRITILFFLSSCIQIAAGQDRPKSAEAILNEACQLAAKQKKNVFIIFHASWCGWCHKMDSAMNDETCRDLFDRHYIIRHLVVYESEKNKGLENPGGLDMLKKYNGHDQGIPFWLVFDSGTHLLADSKKRPPGAGLDQHGENTGCPATKEEIEHFIEVLAKTSKLNKEELAVIEKRFSQGK